MTQLSRSLKDERLRVQKFLRRYSFIIFELSAQEIREKYTNTHLGVIWLFAYPLIIILVILTSMGGVRKIDGITDEVNAFIVVLLYLVWYAHIGTISQSLSMYRSNRPFLSQIDFPSIIVPIKSSLASFSVCSAVYVLILTVGIASSQLEATRAIVGFIAFASLYPSLLSLSIIIGSLTLFARDLEQGIPILLFLMIYLLPIFYTEKTAPPAIILAITINPFSNTINLFRDIFYGNSAVPSLEHATYYILMSILLAFLAKIVHKTIQPVISELI